MLAVTLVSGCTNADEPYFQEPFKTGVGAPRTVETTTFVGVAWVVANGGDEVRLLEAEPLDPQLGKGSLSWYVLQLNAPDHLDSMGIAGEGDALVDQLTPLAGAPVQTGPRQDPTAATEIVAAIRGEQPGVMHFSAVRLRFSVNGNERVQDFPMEVTLCVDDPAPAECEALDSDE
jgi:hypothetical protein